jgi:hypothetical protein
MDPFLTEKKANLRAHPTAKGLRVAVPSDIQNYVVLYCFKCKTAYPHNQWKRTNITKRQPTSLQLFDHMLLCKKCSHEKSEPVDVCYYCQACRRVYSTDTDAHRQKYYDHMRMHQQPVKGTASVPATRTVTLTVRKSEDQCEFKKALVQAQGEEICVITKSPLVVEAAHMIAFADGGDYDISNGILLSVNWHRLMDAGIYTILLFVF